MLDLAAGTGTSSQPFRDRGAFVVPCDFSVGMLRVGKQALPQLPFVAGDATRLPFATETFDRVITSEVLEHIQADVDAIAELVRVLKTGGTFACTVPSEWPETINWRLSDEYHAPKSVGGHVRMVSGMLLLLQQESATL